MINSSEKLFVVDENDIPVVPLERKVVHATGAWHRVAHVWIHDGEGNILCQHRSLKKDTNPGLWEGFFGGHIAEGAEPLQSAIAEVGEELGLKLAPGDLHFAFKYAFHSPDNTNNEFQYVYVLHIEGGSTAFNLEKDEVEEVAWISLPKVAEAVRGEGAETWTNLGYEPRILEAIQNAANAAK
jgi:isopentenyldiphosphate isomerase